MADYPKGFDELAVQRTGRSVKQMLDAFDLDPDKIEAFDRYNLARDVYDDAKVVSKLIVDPGIDSYQIPLLKRVVNLAASYIADSLTALQDWFVFDGGPPESGELREKRQRDTQKVLDMGEYEIAVRKIALNAVLYNRGTFRLRWRKVFSLENPGEPIYCLPIVEPWEPKAFVWYPLSAQHWSDARLIGGYLRISRRDIVARQKRGEYFDVPVPIVGTANTDTDAIGQTQTAFPDDESPRVFTGMVWLPPEGEEATGESMPAKDAPEYRCYRVTLIYDTAEILELAPYDLPIPEWFAPTPNPDTSRFFAKNSIATNALELAAIMNDNYTTQILSAIAAAKQTVYASNVAGDMATEPIGVGAFVSTSSDAKFWSPPVGARNGEALMIQSQEINRMADGVVRVSETGAGQAPRFNQTATATAAVLAGQLAGTKDYKLTMIGPMEDAVDLIQIQMRRHFPDVRRVHGEVLETKTANEWGPKFQVQANGRSPSNDPAALVAKIGQFIQLAQALGIQIAPDGTTIDGGKLFDLAGEGLDMPFDLAGIVVRPDEQQNANADPAGGPLGPDMPAAIAQLLQSGPYTGPVSVPHPALGGAPAPMPGGVGQAVGGAQPAAPSGNWG